MTQPFPSWPFPNHWEARSVSPSTWGRGRGSLSRRLRVRIPHAGAVRCQCSPDAEGRGAQACTLPFDGYRAWCTMVPIRHMAYLMRPPSREGILPLMTIPVLTISSESPSSSRLLETNTGEYEQAQATQTPLLIFFGTEDTASFSELKIGL